MSNHHVADQVSHPNRATVNTVMLNVVIFRSLDREDKRLQGGIKWKSVIWWPRRQCTSRTRAARQPVCLLHADDDKLPVVPLFDPPQNIQISVSILTVHHIFDTVTQFLGHQ
jgi:hypothetical protein